MKSTKSSKTLKGKKSTVTSSKTSKAAPFPEKQLKAWLKNRRHWNHHEWLGLLDDLRAKGYSHHVDCEGGHAKIGQFLETKREKI
jgi:hypothetical protein